ncbi:hypothetical protein HY500_04150 [Candidatus Woesearchaeota archaeon]|nr:hypothetical protein [Candidatus Woesearchaeota archaeon]
MTLREPQSMDECVYFTNRAVGKGKIRAWVFRGNCPKCDKGVMGKPKDPKTGRAKIRKEEYECPECKYNVPQTEYEDTLAMNIQYTCHKCNHASEISVPFKRKKVQRIDEETGKKETVEAVRFLCEKCNEKIDVTKKMK